MILLNRGEHEEVRRLALAGEFKTFKFSPEEVALEQLLKLAWLDGAVAVARAMLKQET